MVEPITCLGGIYVRKSSETRVSCVARNGFCHFAAFRVTHVLPALPNMVLQIYIGFSRTLLQLGNGGVRACSIVRSIRRAQGTMIIDRKLLWVCAAKPALPGIDQPPWAEAFRRLDKDGSGGLDLTEFQARCLGQLGANGLPCFPGKPWLKPLVPHG